MIKIRKLISTTDMAKISLLIFSKHSLHAKRITVATVSATGKQKPKITASKILPFFRKPCFTESIKNQIRYSHECKRMLKIIINPIVKLFTPNGVSHTKPSRNKRPNNRYPRFL